MKVRTASAALAPRSEAVWSASAKELLDADPAGNRGVEAKAELLVEAFRGDPAVQVDPVEAGLFRHLRHAAHQLPSVAFPAVALGADEVVHEEVLAAGERVRAADSREGDDPSAVEEGEEPVSLPLLPLDLGGERLLADPVAQLSHQRVGVGDLVGGGKLAQVQGHASILTGGD